MKEKGTIRPVGSNIKAKAEVSVDQGGGWRLSDDLNGSEWLQDALRNTIEVDWLEATNSMAETNQLGLVIRLTCRSLSCRLR
jgi:hypothetical protein